MEKTSTKEDLRLLLSFYPDRLSHVIHVPESIREELRKRNVALELCISCNVHTRMLVMAGTEGGYRTGSYGDHHFGRWFQEQQCPVMLCVSLSVSLRIPNCLIYGLKPFVWDFSLSN